MAKTLANCGIWFDSLEIDSSTNKVQILMSNAELIGTTFADSAVRRYAGLGDSSISASGFCDWPDPDLTIYNDLGSGLVPVSVAMNGPNPVAGSPAYFINAQVSSFGRMGKSGEIDPFSMKAAGSDLICQGVLAQTGNVVANGSSAVYQFTAPVDNLHAVCAALHVTAFGGVAPTLTVILQSATTIGFAGPTTRASFNVVNGAVSGQFVRAPGPITDQFWRLNWTIGGSVGPNFTFAGLIGFGS